jgi:hypothetical protein
MPTCYGKATRYELMDQNWEPPSTIKLEQALISSLIPIYHYHLGYPDDNIDFWKEKSHWDG